MADQFNSIANQPGVATELVQAAYDLVVGEQLRALPTARNFVSYRPQRPAMNGSSITLEKVNWFTDAQVNAAATPLAEELDVESIKMPKPDPITITPNEYGMASVTTIKLANRAFTPVDPIKAQLVTDHMWRVIDKLVQDKMVTGTNVLTYQGDVPANAATYEGTVTNAFGLTAKAIRSGVTRLRAANVPTYEGGFYAMLTNPKAVHNLREETGSGSWRVPNEYGTDQSRIWAGELGEFEGVRFVQNNLTRTTATGASGATVYQNYLMGAQALAEHVVREPGVVVGPETDRLRRFHTLGWYGDLGFALYRNEALIRILTGSTVS